MSYLLDTSTFLWASSSPRQLSRKAQRICESPSAEKVVSAATLWELIAKCSIGKIRIRDADATLPGWIATLNARVLPVHAAHAYAAYALPLRHRDPFDRMLVAQAVADDLTLVTSDEAIQSYPVKWVW